MADGSVKIDIEADGSDAEKALKDVEQAAQQTGDGLEKAGDGAKKAEKDFGALTVAAGTLVADALTSVISGAADTVAALLELSESTREYRDDMAKLESAFANNGLNAEQAKSVYEDFYSVLGESDRSVEAANHLATMTNNMQELNTWGHIVSGVTAKFGDSLPIEGLTEAANETAKLGEVTGPLADALNWAAKEGETFGVTLKENTKENEAWNTAVKEATSAEEYFNLALQECTTEQERATLITDTLNRMYREAGDAYDESTRSIQDARYATLDMEEAQAKIGEALEPVTTAWTNLKTRGLEAITPAIEKVSEGIQNVTQWLREHETAATIITAVVLALAAAFTVFAVALGIAGVIQLVTVAMASLGTVIAFITSPITLVIAGIAALVAAFLYLWNNCEGFRNFWIALWENIVAIASQVWAVIVAKFSEAWAAIQAAWAQAAPYLSAVWEAIKAIFSVVKAVLSGFFSDAWLAIKGIASVWASFFSGVWSNIRDVFASVSSWFRGIFQSAYTAITNIWDSISGYFADLYADITGAFDGVLSDFASVGSNIISGIWNGLSAGWSWLTGKVSDLAASLFEAAKDALGIASPSKAFKWIGKMSADGVGVGFAEDMPRVERDISGDLAGLTARAQASVSAESARVGRSFGRTETGYTDLARAVGIQTAGINSLSAEYRRGSANMRPVILELDGRELGRAVAHVGAQETSRVGVKLALGGAL